MARRSLLHLAGSQSEFATHVPKLLQWLYTGFFKAISQMKLHLNNS
ncbi:hypothetical protein MED297_15500 [Reinekea sp. MED297]|uniref:Uncharacterized protein n=1 Tax=Reinekea blandensis MED297 TaxID=314283 RepID=A4BIM4_9GAMM|nr:hypothetical protein MED297_15500 [Reinekea sp. MED297] [Reinekea blandensis MED297]